jgi:hypothetical protein
MKTTTVYLLLVHNNPLKVKRLIDSLFVEDNTHFVIHVDARCDMDSFMALLSHHENITFIEKRSKVDWGGGSMIIALMNLLESIPADVVNSMNYCVLLSGMCYPVKNQEYLTAYFNQAHGEFICGTQIPSANLQLLEGGLRRLNCHALRLSARKIASIEPFKFNIGNLKQFVKVLLFNPLMLKEAIRLFFMKKRDCPLLPLYYGSFWFCLSRKAVEFLKEYMNAHVDYVEYCKRDLMMPDEEFIHTMLYNNSSLFNLRNTNLRYEHWIDQKASSPRCLTIHDAELINQIVENPDVLFCRKVEEEDVKDYIDTLVRRRI